MTAAVRLEAVDELAFFQQSTHEQLHEVRATLAGVAHAVRLLVRHESELGTVRKRRLEAMLESEVARLERLLSDRRPPALSVSTVADVIGPVVLARRLAGQVIHWVPTGATAICVEDFLAEVLNILLVNAAKHAGSAHVQLDVLEGPEFVQVRVCDTGPGIPPALRQRIFEPGFRGDDAGDQGIGLALARRMAMAMGGTLRLEDNEGPGATFVLCLPASPGTPA